MRLFKQQALLSFLIFAACSAQALTPTSPLQPCHNAAKWTGFYAGAGAGMGAWTADSKVTINGVAVTATQTQGGKGGFVMAGLGYDYLFQYDLLAGAFIDGNYGRLSGSSAFSGAVGDQSETGSLGLGGRIGKLISPTVLPYLTAGFSRAYFDHVNFNFALAGNPSLGLYTSAFTANGYFLGAGIEAIVYKNWSLKGEYRYASYDRENLGIQGSPILVGTAKMPTQPTTQTFIASINYKI